MIFAHRLAAALLGVAAVASASGAEFHIGAHNFTLPDGFTIEKVTTPELVERPVSASFDDQGRLYVTDSSGSNEKPAQQLLHPTHRIRRLEDTNADGTFDRSVVFADKLAFPEGCLWHEGSVYVAVPPSILKFTDTNGDGVADKREEWYKGGALTGCANDVHGPTLGPDGLIYWTKGAFAYLTNIVDWRGRKITDRAAHVFRARPDGSHLEVVMTGGMDNPVEVAFSPGGDVFFVTTFVDFTKPGRRDGVCYSPLGAIFGKIHDVIEDRSILRTGDLISPIVQVGAGAPSSLCSYDSDVFGHEYRGNLFASLFNLHKVTRHAIRPKGAGFESADSDFVVSDNPDFHPTDVLEDADGSLLIVDTGGWYKLCCPSSQLAKADVLGAIYRVRKTGVRPVEDPRGLSLAWKNLSPKALAKLLDDPRPAVRGKAIAALRKAGPAAREALIKTLTAKAKNPSQSAAAAPDISAAKLNAVWALTGESLLDDKAQAVLADSRDPALLNAWFHAAGVRRDPSVEKLAIRLLNLPADKASHGAKRAALEYLFAFSGTRGAGLKTPAGALTTTLLANIEKDPAFASDPFLAHSTIHILAHAGQVDALKKALHTSHPDVQRAALIALDQIEGGKLTPDEAADFLNSSHTSLREAARWIVRRNPGWGTGLADWFRRQMASTSTGPARDELVRLLSQFASNDVIQKLLAEKATLPDSQLIALRAMGGASVQKLPTDWIEAARAALKDRNADVNRAAIAVARKLAAGKEPSDTLDPELTALGDDSTKPSDVRLDALSARVSGKPLSAPAFSFVRSQFAPDSPAATRGAAAAILPRSKLDAAQRAAVVDLLHASGPIEIGRLIESLATEPSEPIGKQAVQQLADAKGFSGLRFDQLKAWLARFPAPVQAAGEPLLTRLNQDAGKQKARLETIASQLPKGDVRRGQSVFNSAKAACATCHTMGYLGGNLGPDLTRIGEVRTERDLLESIVFPSASFVRSYEPSVVVTKGGDQVSGILKRDDSTGVLILTGPNAEQEIARSDIAEVLPGTVSVMPGGLDEQLTRQELADLVAFLKFTTWGPR